MTLIGQQTAQQFFETKLQTKGPSGLADGSTIQQRLGDGILSKNDYDAIKADYATSVLGLDPKQLADDPSLAKQVDEDVSAMLTRVLGEDSLQGIREIASHQSDAVGLAFRLPGAAAASGIPQVVRLQNPKALPGQDRIFTQASEVSFSGSQGVQIASAGESFQIAMATRPPLPERQLSYHLRNTPETLSNDFLLAAKQALKGKSALTEPDAARLLASAVKSHGVISEEEIKFLAALTVPANAKHFISQAIPPAAKEYAFSGIPEYRVSNLRQQSFQKLDALASSYVKGSQTDRLLRQNPQLQAFFNAVNDETLTPAQRQAMIEAYRGNSVSANFDLAAVVGPADFLSSGLRSTDAVKQNTPALYDPNDKPGIYGHLVHEAQQPPMTDILMELTQYVISRKNTLISPQDLFKKGEALAARHGITNPVEQRRYALRAITTITTLVHGASFPAQFNPLKANLKQAYQLIHERSTGGGSVVMSHDVRATPSGGSGQKTTQDTTRDNNFHFFYHAYVASELMHRGYDEYTAQRTSALLGAVYELEPEQLQDDQGNASVKDILVNAYGAQFGVLLAKGNFSRIEDIFPQAHEGPQIQNERDF